MKRGVVAGLLLLTLPLSACAERKKLLYFGWAESDTVFLRRHVREMEKSPFDGLVLHASTRAGESLTWKAWGRRAFRPAELAPALEDLKATRTRRLRHNFLRLNTTPADIDWFDDFGAVLANARLAAGIAREGRCVGILLDTEQYEGQLFDYARQRDAARRSWVEYAAQARRRGREYMQALQAGYPRLTVFLTFGHTLPYGLMRRDGKPLPEVSCGLLVPFLDGMIEGARKGRIVDGCELSYGWREPQLFASGRQAIHARVLERVADPRKYARVVSAGFGIWIDYDWRRLGWNAEDPSANYFSPERLEASVRAALANADEYVWIYSETPRWWSPQGGPVSLPPAYDLALRRAREKADAAR
jgi:hypothetical protein